jgi:hypothetical protein
MGSQQMMELLLKEIRTNQEKVDAKMEAWQEEIRTNQAKTKAGHKELLAIMEANREERRVSQEKL